MSGIPESSTGRSPTGQLVLDLAVSLWKQLLQIRALQVAQQLSEESISTVCRSSCGSPEKKKHENIFHTIFRPYLNSGGNRADTSSFLIGMSFNLNRSLKLVEILLVSGTLRPSAASSSCSSCRFEPLFGLSFSGLFGLQEMTALKIGQMFAASHLNLSLVELILLPVVLLSSVGWLVGWELFSPPSLWVKRSSKDRGLNVVVDRVGGVGGGGRRVKRLRVALVVVLGAVVVLLVVDDDLVNVFFSSSFS